nr:odorant receptor 59b-like [Drosophila virilis]
MFHLFIPRCEVRRLRTTKAECTAISIPVLVLFCVNFFELYVPIGLSLSLAKNFSDFTPGDFLSVLQIFFNASGATAKTIVVLFLFSRLSQMESVLDAMDERLSFLLWDTYPLIFLVMMRAHIDVLRNRIRNLRTDPHKTEAENYDELVCSIMDHKLILKCCEIMRPVISGIIFVHFQLVGVVLGVTMINILYFSDFIHGISSIIYLTGILLESFPCCYLSDLLAEDSKHLSNLLAQSNWISAERKYKSTLIIFIQHVQRPTEFIAGGIFPISMNSNIKMAKFAFSVMTIVQQMNLADRLE